MELFDKISKTVSETGHRTRDLADIGKFNTKIYNNETQIGVLYKELGELYYETHSEDPEDALAEKVTAIRDLKAENKEYQEQIRTLRGLIKCPKCGAEVKDNVLYCPSCGYRLLPENIIMCPSCGKLLEDDMVFCQYCGARLTGQEDAQDTSGEDQKEEQKFVCKCGAVFEDDALFCRECGAKRTDLEAERAQTDGGEDTVEPDTPQS